MGGADCIPVLIGRLSETARRNGAIDIDVIYERCIYIYFLMLHGRKRTFGTVK